MRIWTYIKSLNETLLAGIIFAVVVLLLTGIYTNNGYKLHKPICPDDYGTDDAGSAEYLKAINKWTNDFYDTHPDATLSEWAEARHAFWIENNCTKALQGYEDYVAGNVNEESQKTIEVKNSNHKAVYYGVPSEVHPSYRYYQFNRYDLDENKIVDSSLTDSSFWAETDYADINWIENGERMFSNKWIKLIDDNPNAIFKITGEIKENDCYNEKNIIEKEYCFPLGEPHIIIYDMEIVGDL